MTFRSLRSFPLLTGLLAGLLAPVLLVGGGPSATRGLSPLASVATHDFDAQSPIMGTRRVNAPHFDGRVTASESAIFWFGRVTPTENSVDVRVGYNDDHLRIHVATFDRRLWYDRSPSPEDLIDWDSATLYLDTGEDVYRFDSQMVWWEERDDYQTAYRLDGSDWIADTTPFTTTSGWRGNAPNDDEDDRGWWTSYDVPFESVGLDGPPAQRTDWGLALTLHDRDDGAGTPIADQVWPETMASQQPVTWGQLAFGMPTHSPQRAIPDGTVTIRQGLEGATVVDADVGGSSDCAQPLWPDFFPTWGDLNYASKEFINIQNQADVADWPCFSRYYVTFPLDALPSDKVIISATLRLHLWGGAGEGWDPGPQPSLIQVLTVGQDWDESTLTWNNAPLARENVSATWVEPVDEYAEPPGIPYEWDVGRALAEAYARSEPLRLALYEADFDYHSGKYFHSSDVGDWNAEGRPTLSVTWGRAIADLDKTAAPTSGSQGSPIAYTLSFFGSGNSLALTDTLPSGIGAPGNFELEGTSVKPTYDSDQHRLTWSDTPRVGREVAIRYIATIATGDSQALVNTAELSEAGGRVSGATVTVIANPKLLYLPLILRDD
jgi:hypothetical protein